MRSIQATLQHSEGDESTVGAAVLSVGLLSAKYFTSVQNKESMAAAVSAQRLPVRDDIRTLVQTRRIRVTQFFQDYDKLRSGYVTTPQFFRCLWQTMNLQLSPEKEQEIIEKYDVKKDGHINYRLFCEEIDLSFNPKDVHDDPILQKVEAPEFLGTSRSVQPLTRTSEEHLVNILRRMEHFYRVNGINLRTAYEDFDTHHMGVVTESQFYRSFPGPSSIEETDIRLLVDKYKDPAKPGQVNYLNLHHDILAVGDHLTREKTAQVPEPTQVDYIPLILSADPALNQIFDKLRVAIFKNRIRSLEFFKDYDRLRSGVITENQFVCGLVLAASKEAQLSRAEIQKIVEFYRIPDGRVRYREFCDMLENTFTVPDLEKKPTETVTRPLIGSLFRNLKPLNPSEEERVLTVLHELREKCRQQRVMMYQYFKDYDRSQAYTRVVTPLQFGRILHFLGMNVDPPDFRLLVIKFQDPSTGDVDYPSFVQAVDDEFVGHVVETKVEDAIPVEKKVPDVVVSFDDLMARIRNIVLTKRLRVNEYFQDFDLLRSGSISKARFRRCLTTMGLSKLGQHDLNDSQFVLLCRMYQNPAKEDQVLWTKFAADLERVFTKPGLEKEPTTQVPPQEIFRVPVAGTVDWNKAEDNHRQAFDAAIARLQRRVEERRILLRPVFKDFDLHKNGHVTRIQFRRCLAMVDMPVSDPELAALEARFIDDVGINYISFLQILQPSKPEELMYIHRLEDIQATNAKGSLPELNAVGDLEQILLKIKTKVSKERICAGDFMQDYDKLNSGRMLKNTFRRALILARLELYESEMSILEDKYQSMKDPSCVDYKHFCDEVESVFTTKHLEKMPLEEVMLFKPPVEWELNDLSPEENEKFVGCMTKIKEKVRQHRMQLFPLFEDYDKVHNGYVSRSQFRRVLTELQLESMLTESDLMLIFKQFQVRIGGRVDVNYIAFCEMVYHMAGFEWRIP